MLDSTIAFCVPDSTKGFNSIFGTKERPFLFISFSRFWTKENSDLYIAPQKPFPSVVSLGSKSSSTRFGTVICFFSVERTLKDWVEEIIFFARRSSWPSISFKNY